MRQDKAELELQEFLKDGPLTEKHLVDKWKSEGKSTEQILEFLKNF